MLVTVVPTPKYVLLVGTLMTGRQRHAPPKYNSTPKAKQALQVLPPGVFTIDEGLCTKSPFYKFLGGMDLP